MNQNIAVVPIVADLSFRERCSHALGISVPIILALSSQNLLNVVDTWIVGQLGSLELACVALGSTINWVFCAFFIGMGGGVQAMVARRVGEDRADETIGVLNRSLFLILVAVIPLTLFVSIFSEWGLAATTSRDDILLVGDPYLCARLAGIPFVAANFSFRGYWNGLSLSRIYLRTLVFIHVINIGLTYVLVFGFAGIPAMGVFGAGISTTIAQALGTIYYCLQAGHVGPVKGFLKRGYQVSIRSLLRLGTPVGIQSLLFSLGFLIFFTITERLGTQQLGATQVLVTMALISILPGVGFGLGGASLVGQSLGAGRVEDARYWGWLCMAMAAISVGLIGLGEALTAPFWMNTFIATDPMAAQIGITPLRIIGSIMVFDVIGVVLMNTLIGAGATTTVMWWSALTQYGIMLPAAWYAALHTSYGLIGLWSAFAIYRVIFALSMVVIWKGNSWTKAQV
ncbi:MAG TPA: MATE family efflux transporter [Myxococcales bacterium]|nr:MATE family efflux transporter [Myxococcales bacterium]HIN85301.1 MATE family efflux transporter [Myxococcales bacterium]